MSVPTLSSSTTQLICSFLMPYPTGTNFEAPQRSPSICTERTHSSSFAISVSSSHYVNTKNNQNTLHWLQYSSPRVQMFTYRLDVQQDGGLGNDGGFLCFLGSIGFQSLLLEAFCLFIFLITAKQVYV
ncbi:hypothetical protein GOODEAATRI_029283, partial [Goodea atripinnis]